MLEWVYINSFIVKVLVKLERIYGKSDPVTARVLERCNQTKRMIMLAR